MDTPRFNSWEGQKDEFQDYVNKWEDALKNGIFETPRNPNGDKEDSFFDMIKKEPKSEFNPNDVDYWNKIQDMDVNDANVEIINEEKKSNKVKKNKKSKVKKLLASDKNSAANFKTVDNSLANDKSKNNIVKKASKLGNNPNPIYHDSYGKDTRDESGKTRVTAGFSADDRLPALQDLYKSLYQLEVKMSNKEGLNKKLSEKMQAKIKKVRDSISEISDSMGGDFKSATDYN
jgi:hypothetical protein